MPRQFFLLLICLTSRVCLLSQDSLNMVKYANVDIPNTEYGNCWGWVAPNGDEFAIIGHKTAINVYNVTNPRNPVLVHQRVDGSNTIWREFKSYQNFIYGVCESSEGLEILNMNGYNFFQSTQHFTTAHTLQIDVPNGRLYVAGSNQGAAREGLVIYDLTQNPGNPTMIKKINFDTLLGNPSLNMYVHDVYVKDGIAYASHGYSGFYIWDLNDVNNIQLLGSLESSGSNQWYNHSSWLHDNGQYSYVAEEVPNGRPMAIFKLETDGQGNIAISDIKRFKDPLALPATNNTPHNPYVLNNGLYISYYHDGIQIYDVTSPENPIRVAYYDTYPENNGSYSGYHGAWGVYPYLPSGTIIASDIEHGLYTLGLRFGRMNIQTGELYVQEAGKGIVIMDSLGVNKRISVSNAGAIVLTTVASPTGKNYVKNGDVEIVTPEKGIILTSPSGSTYSIKISNTGVLSASSVSPPATATKISSGDLYLDNMHKGFILHSQNGFRWKTSISKSGLLKSYRFSF